MHGVFATRVRDLFPQVASGLHYKQLTTGTEARDAHIGIDIRPTSAMLIPESAHLRHASGV
eukprot:1816268-Alexandrium_andersonii.AAC.1